MGRECSRLSPAKMGWSFSRRNPLPNHSSGILLAEVIPSAPFLPPLPCLAPQDPLADCPSLTPNHTHDPSGRIWGQKKHVSGGASVRECGLGKGPGHKDAITGVSPLWHFQRSLQIPPLWLLATQPSSPLAFPGIPGPDLHFLEDQGILALVGSAPSSLGLGCHKSRKGGPF